MPTNTILEVGVRVSIKELYGAFGSKITRSEEFCFCADSISTALSLASANVPSRTWPHAEKVLQVTYSLPVLKPEKGSRT